ncbi:hypothetical protein QJS10_CPA03g01420 [Acorus calamus]|uniref:Uncharacterized protein n=1 Tax=Acorus calamus TaxID=4465 RepID=A0AAV9F4J3_ACOCL|nr:hypothetical protein QJS10_CPA03g01420 [Acorus calamus]
MSVVVMCDDDMEVGLEVQKDANVDALEGDVEPAIGGGGGGREGAFEGDRSQRRWG